MDWTFVGIVAVAVVIVGVASIPLFRSTKRAWADRTITPEEWKEIKDELGKLERTIADIIRLIGSTKKGA